MNVVAAVALVHRHLASSMCATVFHELRTIERARKWTLDMMFRFWVAVVVHAPPSLREAMEVVCGEALTVAPVKSSTSSFFELAQNLRWEFFRELFDRFVTSILPECPAGFERELRATLSPDFKEVFVFDGSGMERVAHKLKIVRGVSEVLIPGSILACYDLFRGIVRQVHYSEKLLGDEAKRLRAVLDGISNGALIVADRGDSSVRLLAAIAKRVGLHGLVRLKRNVVASVVEELGRYVDDGCEVVDRLVMLGTGGKGVPRLRVRLIEKRLATGEVLRLATTVLDPAKLPALVALTLSRKRWKVERLFHTLKVVLNLRRFYAANTNAVAQQIYTCAIVYNALRVTQAQIAQTHDLEPEALSTAKLLPCVATTHMQLIGAIQGFDLVQKLNPGVKLVEPDWAQTDLATTPLKRLLVAKRNGPRKKPGYSKARTRTVALSRFEKRRSPRGSSP